MLQKRIISWRNIKTRPFLSSFLWEKLSSVRSENLFLYRKKFFHKISVDDTKWRMRVRNNSWKNVGTCDVMYIMMLVRSAIIIFGYCDKDTQWHVMRINYIRNWVGWLLMTLAGELAREKSTIAWKRAISILNLVVKCLLSILWIPIKDIDKRR